MSALWTDLADLIERGGWVMLPLLFLSIVSLALIVERIAFWVNVHRPRRMRWLLRVKDALRKGDRDLIEKLAFADRSPYAEVVRQLLKHGVSEAVAVEAMELQRPKFDRFMVSMSTIITAAPLLGILGTVIGIIQSFGLLGQSATELTDPTAVSLGIARALLTTALGLVVALVTLFPYMIFRSQVERAIGRVESTIAAAQQGAKRAGDRADRSVEIGTGPAGRTAREVEAGPASASA